MFIKIKNRVRELSKYSWRDFLQDKPQGTKEEYFKLTGREVETQKVEKTELIEETEEVEKTEEVKEIKEVKKARKSTKKRSGDN